jgi:hypothetical protein
MKLNLDKNRLKIVIHRNVCVGGNVVCCINLMEFIDKAVYNALDSDMQKNVFAELVKELREDFKELCNISRLYFEIS